MTRPARTRASATARARGGARAGGTMMMGWMCLVGMISRCVGAPARASALSRRAVDEGEGAVRGRALGGGAAARRVRGGVLGAGALSARFELAADGQAFDLIVDTGSSRTYFPCKGCAACGSHGGGGYYDYDRSASFHRLNCRESADGSTCANVSGTCATDGTCGYAIHYQEGSSSTGYIVRDVVWFGGTVPNATVAFGCAEHETGAIFSQEADGLFGFGRERSTIREQLAHAGLIDNAFGLCIEGFGRDGGMMTLGKFDFGGDAPSLAHTTMLSNNAFFEAMTSSWSLGDSIVQGSSQTTTIFDSGTTFTFVPSSMYLDFINSLNDAALYSGLELVDGPDPEYEDTCYGNAGELNQYTVSEYFPELTIRYAGTGDVRLSPENYLFMHEKNESAFCVGVFENDREYQILLGQITMRDTFIEFDVAQEKISFGSVNCRSLREKYADNARNATPIPPSPSPLPSPPPSSPPPSLSPSPNATGPPSTPDSSHGGSWDILVFLAMPLLAILGIVGGSAILKRSSNDRQWRRLEDDIVQLDAEIEMSDVP